MKFVASTLILVCMTYAVSGQTDRPVCGTPVMMEQLIKEHPEELAGIMAASYAEDSAMHAETTYKINTDDVITIPVVVHVVYKTAAQNISDAQIQSQIDVLNEDYRRLNSDATNTPAAFQSVAADAKIEFCLAQRDPNGNPSNGITRTVTTVDSWPLATADQVKNDATGGVDPWPKADYLNIWVCNLDPAILGYAYYPGVSASLDGAVIGYKYFGDHFATVAPYNLGRTATHEIGHWLNLIHVWGDDGGACTGSDYCADTPNQGSENYGCPNYPHTDACSPTSPGVMFMDYMDYVNDNCMNMFTQDQVDRMRTALNTTRISIQNSKGCYAVNIEDLVKNQLESITVFPNPSTGNFTVKAENFKGNTLTCEIYDFLGALVQRSTAANSGSPVSFSLAAYPQGNYLVRISDGTDYITKEITVTH